MRKWEKKGLTGESISSRRSTEQRSHCSRVSARCMIFLTIFSRSVCSSNRSLTTSSKACSSNNKHRNFICSLHKHISTFLLEYHAAEVNVSLTCERQAYSMLMCFGVIIVFSYVFVKAQFKTSHPAPFILLARLWKQLSIGNRYSTEW